MFQYYLVVLSRTPLPVLGLLNSTNELLVYRYSISYSGLLGFFHLFPDSVLYITNNLDLNL
jgi:hypothetical protein